MLSNYTRSIKYECIIVKYSACKITSCFSGSYPIDVGRASDAPHLSLPVELSFNPFHPVHGVQFRTERPSGGQRGSERSCQDSQPISLFFYYLHGWNR